METRAAKTMIRNGKKKEKLQIIIREVHIAVSCYVLTLNSLEMYVYVRCEISFGLCVVFYYESYLKQ